MTNICVIGMGYVGISHAIMLAQKNNVTILEVSKEKIDLFNKKESPIKDSDIEYYLKNKKLNISADINENYDFKPFDIIIIALPTNYNENEKSIDTGLISNSIKSIRQTNEKALIVIKSTIPIGFMSKLSREVDCQNIIFSPEFLREGQALYDNLNPTRIVIGTMTGDKNSDVENYIRILYEVVEKNDTPVVMMKYAEAEAVKLFSNTYLAMRVAFFNELDTYAEHKGLDTKSIIEGVCFDPRISFGYNNPGFGYGGYCLPKDTKQLLNNFENVPQDLISAIVNSNTTRKAHIAEQIINMTKNMQNPVVGIYRLQMKSGSDNARESGVLDIISILLNRGIKVVVYEPSEIKNVMDDRNYIFEDELSVFKRISTVILANRMSEELRDVVDKVYTRDVYNYL